MSRSTTHPIPTLTRSTSWVLAFASCFGLLSPQLPVVAAAPQGESAVRAQDHAIVRGRCVDGEGRPLAAVEVELSSRESGPRKTWRRNRDFTYQVASPVTTDASGAFELRFRPAPGHHFEMVARRDGWTSASRVWPEIAAGQVIDLGAVVLDAGVRVRGELVGANGLPISHRQIFARRQGERPEGRERDGGFEGSVVTDDKGAFMFPEVLLPGAWTFRVHKGEVVEPLDGAQQLVEVGGVQRLRIALKADGTPNLIAGRVVDVAGNLIPHAVVTTPGLRRTALMGPEFSIERTEMDRQGSLSLQVFAEGYEPFLEDSMVAWGTTSHVITLVPGPNLRLKVIDGRTGERIERFQVVRTRVATEMLKLRGALKDQLPALLTESGRDLIGPLSRGLHVLRVLPEDPSLAPSAWTVVSLEGVPPEVQITLHPPRQRTVRVVARDGRPVAGTRVELVLVSGDGEWASTTEARTLVPEDNRLASPLTLLAEGVTDEQGEVAFVIPDDQQHLMVRATGADHVPELRTVSTWPAHDEALELPVRRGAEVVLHIANPQQLIELTNPSNLNAAFDTRFRPERLRLVPQWETQNPDVYRDVAETSADGTTLRFRQITPGDWNLQIRNLARTGILENGPPVLRLLAIEDLQEGEVRDITLDLARFQVGTLAGSLHLDGKPAAGRRVRIEGQLSGFAGVRPKAWSRVVTLDESGSYELRTLPGDYRLTLLLESGAQTQTPANRIDLRLPEVLTVQPGELHRADLAYETVPFILRLTNATGEFARPHQTLRPRSAGESIPCAELTTDESGLARGWVVAGSQVVVEARKTGTTYFVPRDGTLNFSERWNEVATLTPTVPGEMHDIRLP